MPRTYIAIVLDRSTSMCKLQKQVLDIYNNLVDSIVKSAGKEHETFVSLLTFSSSVSTVFALAPAAEARKLTAFPCVGMTALFDATGKAYDYLKSQVPISHATDAFLINVITDGQENNSFRYNANRIRQIIQEGEKDGRWTFAFNLPVSYKETFVSKFGIPEENCREWEQTTEGLKETEEKTAVGMSNYFADRAAGQTATRSFYKKVDADLSTLKTDDLKNLKDVSSQFKHLKVDREVPIKEFVVAATGKDYIVGSSYYQLTKPEMIQPTKKVLLKKKGERAIYAGEEARKLIGLPTDGTKAKLTPLDLAKFEVYISSTSLNRKLVRGTTLLIDTTKVVSDPLTWTLPPTATTAAA